MKKCDSGCVHGRFQLFHNDHLRYIMKGFERSESLIIGITSFINSDLITMEAAKHRAVPQNNPFTYYERTEVISNALDDAGVSSDKYSFSPFPIEQPEFLPQFIPYNILCFTTIYDDWNREKVKTLRDRGYEVEVLWESKIKKIEGSNLRDKILRGDDAWKYSVPSATIDAVKSLDIYNRIKKI